MDAVLHPLLRGRSGYARGFREQDPALARKLDAALDAALAAGADQVERLCAGRPTRSLLLLVVASPHTRAAANAIGARLRETMRAATLLIDDRADVPKFAKIGEAIATAAADTDWIIVADDDVVLPARFTDTFVALAEAAELVIAQPAHRLHSYASYAVTQRAPGALARVTRFVEIGQVFALHRRVLPRLLPFPLSRSGWGIDFLWSAAALTEDWRIGVIDATPIEHLRPIGTSYSIQAAAAEASALLWRHAPAVTREQLLGTSEIAIPLAPPA